jgi:ribonuclease P protein component
VKSENISIFAFPNQKDLRRIVVNVSGKVGKAVVRNRIKRIYRELFRKNKEIFPESYDIIISALKDVRNIPRKVLLDEISKAFSKLMKEGNR